MPELDFMITADFVRAEGGVLHMIAAGFEAILTASVPAVRQVGIGIRLRLTAAEARHPHDIELIFQDSDGTRLTQVTGTIGPVPQGQPLPPPGRLIGVVVPFNMPVPLPKYGDYSFELLVDHSSLKSISLVVAKPAVIHPGPPPRGSLDDA
jgi:hypothetical protein